MHRDIHLVFFIMSLVTLVLIHTISLKFSLYFYIEWLDILMHLLGAVTIVFGIFSLQFFKIFLPERWLRWFPVIVVVIIISLLWELFEILFVITVVEEGFIFDTFLDFCMGIVGGSFGYLLVTRLKNLR